MRILTGKVIRDRRIGDPLRTTDTSIFYTVEGHDSLIFKYLKPNMPIHLQEAEIEANSKLKECPFLICATDIVADVEGLSGFFLKRCHRGDLFELVLQSPLRESAARKIFWRVITALEWLHSHGWAHRCVQPENIFLDGADLSEDGIPTDAYLGDLSFAKRFKIGEILQQFDRPVGAPLYCAPELYRGEPYDQTVDIWAFGASLFVALTATAPFAVDPEVDRELFLTYADEEEFELRELRARGVGQVGIDLIMKCLKAMPGERLTASEIKNHAFFAPLAS
jgi:serine/threonine protein kinase